VVIFNDTIVNEGNSLFVIKMRMSIGVSLVTVSSPARVTESYHIIVLIDYLNLHSSDTVTSKPISGSKASPLEIGLLGFFIKSN